MIFLFKLRFFFSALLLSILSMLLCTSAYAQSFEATQIVSPHEIFVGDNVIIQYVFRTSAAIFDDEDTVEAELKSEYPIFLSAADFNNYTVKKISLSHNGNDYNLSISFVPWKPGVVMFRQFDIQDILYYSGLSKDRKKKGSVKIENISVLSISEKTHSTLLQPPEPPVLAPGTIYVVYALIVGCVLLFTALCFLLAHIQSVIAFLHRMKIIMGYGRNARRAMKRIHRLEREESLVDSDFCERLQEITRDYLSYRFDKPFSNYDTRELEEIFAKISSETERFAQKLRIEELISLFHRTDYIRYAIGSLDSKLLPPSQHEAALLSGEREEMCETVCKAISCLEGGVINA